MDSWRVHGHGAGLSHLKQVNEVLLSTLQQPQGSERHSLSLSLSAGTCPLIMTLALILLFCPMMSLRRQYIQTPLPASTKRFCIPEAWQQDVEEELDWIQQGGNIEESVSPWSSPIVVVPKLDTNPWICNTFKRLNQVRMFGCYPLPWVDDHMNHFGSAHFISTLYSTSQNDTGR